MVEGLLLIGIGFDHHLEWRKSLNGSPMTGGARRMNRTASVTPGGFGLVPLIDSTEGPK